MDTAEKLSTTEVKVIELRAEFVSDYLVATLILGKVRCCWGWRNGIRTSPQFKSPEKTAFNLFGVGGADKVDKTLRLSLVEDDFLMSPRRRELQQYALLWQDLSLSLTSYAPYPPVQTA